MKVKVVLTRAVFIKIRNIFMRLTCDLQEALPVCAPEKDSCLPPVDLFPIFYHFLTHLKYQKHQTDKYEILEEATHGHTLKKKNNNNKKNG